MSNLSDSLPALPVSRGARLIRTALWVALDLVMLGVGIALISSHIGRDAGESGGDVSVERAADAVEVGIPRPAPPVATPRPAVPGPPKDNGRPASSPRGPGPERVPPAAKPAPERAPTATPAEAASPTEPAARPVPGPEPGPATAPEEPGSENAPDEGAGPDEEVLPAEEPPAPGGPAPDEEVQRLARRIGLVVDQNRVSLGRCYERAAKGEGASAAVEGQIDIRLTVGPEGRAMVVSVARNDTGSDVLAGCLVTLVRTWDLPSHGYAPIDFIWPFVFHPPDP